MVSVMASGLAENQTITEKNHDYELFTQALTEVCAVLSRKIAKDGEGAVSYTHLDVYKRQGGNCGYYFKYLRCIQRGITSTFNCDQNIIGRARL